MTASSWNDQVAARRAAWAKAHGLKRDRGHCCALRLVGGRCGHRWLCYIGKCWPPGGDHCDLWSRGGRVEVFTFHPYDMSAGTREEVAVFCINLELAFRYEPASEQTSWYFPGGTDYVELRAAGIVPAPCAVRGRARNGGAHNANAAMERDSGLCAGDPGRL